MRALGLGLALLAAATARAQAKLGRGLHRKLGLPVDPSVR
jgi:hypothetical protein